MICVWFVKYYSNPDFYFTYLNVCKTSLFYSLTVYHFCNNNNNIESFIDFTVGISIQGQTIATYMSMFVYFAVYVCVCLFHCNIH